MQFELKTYSSVNPENIIFVSKICKDKMIPTPITHLGPYLTMLSPILLLIPQ